MKHLTPQEIRCILFMADHYQSGKRDRSYVSLQDLPREDGISDHELQVLMEGLIERGLAERRTQASFKIKQEAVNVAYDIRNPPKPDYLKEWSALWRSKPWLVAVTVLAIIAPVLAQWVEWTYALYRIITNSQ